MTSRTDTQAVQAGWYPDPLGMPQLRWWDGRAWTQHTHVRRAAQPTAPAATRFAEPETRTETRTDSAGAGAAPRRHAPTRHGAHELPAGTGSIPELGWAGAALTLHSVQAARVPMLIELGVSGHPTIRIDARHQAYSWELGLEWFPERPAGVVVSIELVGEHTPPPFALPGESLDALLWKVGRAAFPERLAPWLEEGEAYRLTRWPNWTSLAPETDHIRQTAMLANAHLTVDQLAAMSGRTIETTRTLVNALSLMGVLTASAPVDATATPSAPLEGGLFQRLRERFRI
ncbi:DUF2510 domain-containing protein [Homoserinibacter sp. GY 40078]|nr:DUF2510 domain-containing protein [Homoserinibacter sp. GY 40078]TXK19662.1 DUF2510 domain-containing protein [Homoserinibacter sp. GY 40078]